MVKRSAHGSLLDPESMPRVPKEASDGWVPKDLVFPVADDLFTIVVRSWRAFRAFSKRIDKCIRKWRVQQREAKRGMSLVQVDEASGVSGSWVVEYIVLS